VIANAGLATLVLDGAANAVLAATMQLKGAPGVDQVAAFGTKLHVVGKDARLLRITAERVAQSTGCRLQKSETSLEDVFIQLMGASPDNVDG
jgi:ABC-2 type transport system ATP-binding protein